MTSAETLRRPTACVGVVCLRGPDVLLIRRGKAPRLGQWSIPGGRIEPDESVRAAALRELHEETGVEADLLGLIDVVDYFDPERHYVLIDFAARWRSGDPVAADDAAEAVFHPLSDLAGLGLWEDTLRVIRMAQDAHGAAHGA